MSSRLVVKALPKHCTEARLRQHFAAHAEHITDVRLQRTKSGKSRQFGFLGLKTAQAAEQVRAFYSRTFLDTSRIIVEEARPVGDAALPRPWSKYSRVRAAAPAATEGGGGGERGREREGEGGRGEEGAEDAKMAEYMQLMQPKKAGAKRLNAWDNDEAIDRSDPAKRPRRPAAPTADATAAATVGGTADDDDDDDDEYQDLRPPGGGGEAAEEGEMSDLAYMRSKMAGAKWDDDDDEEEEEKGEGEGEGGEEEEEEEEEGKGEGEAEEREEFAEEGGEHAKTEETHGGGAAAEEDLAEHGRLFVRNLPYDTTEESIASVFTPFGPVSEVHLPLDKSTNKGKGTAYVQFSLGDHAVRAMAALDGKYFEGRILHILPSQLKPSRRPAAASGAAAGFKQAKEAKLKELASSSHNWNALFMRADAVGDAVASSLDVEKRDLLLSEGGTSAAVRLAQGETRVIRDTRDWLAKNGVSLDALKRLAEGGPAVASVTERSKTLLLVKNIASSVTQQELRALFAKYGQVNHVLLAPANTLALVEFLEVGEAKRAFRGLAYFKLQGAPLFLEWAPVGVLDAKVGRPEAAEAEASAAAEGVAADAMEAEVEDDGVEGCTLFVKNLNFKTDNAALRAHFDEHFLVRSATVTTKPDPKTPGGRRSMGYGFVEFRSAAEAREALRSMQHTRLHDHTLELKLSSRQAAPAARAAPKADKASSTLMIRNLPFEASKKEVKELFGAFGQVKQARLPKKAQGSHRGFAFVEFATKAEAKKALDALQSTHLYGRHLVLQYAHAEVSVDGLRDKMRAQLEAEAQGGPAALAEPKRKRGDTSVDDLVL